MAELEHLARKRPRLELRAAVISALRNFFNDRGFLEVETPCRIPAPAPELNIDAIPSVDWFLQTSPELCMKRLLAAGYPRLFQIARCWRAGERGSRHLSEFTMLEWYRAGGGYRDLMSDCEALLPELAQLSGQALSTIEQGREVDLALPWQRLTVAEAFQRYADTSVEQALAEDRFDELLVTRIEPQLGFPRPTFLYDYPAELGALARVREDNPSVAERVELYIAGLELANGFSELTDVTEQRRRFVADELARRNAGKPPYPEPELFLADLQQMPAAAGMALGVDRLVMLFAGAATIDEVVAFTTEDL